MEFIINTNSTHTNTYTLKLKSILVNKKDIPKLKRKIKKLISNLLNPQD